MKRSSPLSSSVRGRTCISLALAAAIITGIDMVADAQTVGAFPPTFPTPQPRLYPFELARGVLNVDSPRIAVAKAGDADDAVVVWQQEGLIHGRTFHHGPRMVFPCCWGADTQLGDGSTPGVAMDGSGQAISVWQAPGTVLGRLAGMESRTAHCSMDTCRPVSGPSRLSSSRKRKCQPYVDP
jgi:hypothetical protein